MAMVTILYASTSGHTEYVTQLLEEQLGNPKHKAPHSASSGSSRNPKPIVVRRIRAEVARPEDLIGSDILILASGTWNMDGVEGHLNPHMHEFLYGRAKDMDLKGKKVAIIALGDDRYFYTCRAGERLRRFVLDHGGEVLEPVLLIVNEPYGQEEKVRKWGTKLLSYLVI
ncbi:flavodoxin family protein [Candidatus Peregrinibacteria bacterium]|nr:flavodoxin family protein [Candidatus Peregrinibacteria bacterium]MBI2523976.1 flavodoxin family protein [Candidatus Peregrinibacteria bacterium]